MDYIFQPLMGIFAQRLEKVQSKPKRPSETASRASSIFLRAMTSPAMTSPGIFFSRRWPSLGGQVEWKPTPQCPACRLSTIDNVVFSRGQIHRLPLSSEQERRLTVNSEPLTSHRLHTC